MTTQKALILNEPWATKIYTGEKKIETRMGKLFTHRGDLVICTNQGELAGLAICMVEIWHGRYMVPRDAEQACIEYHPKRGCLFLRNWRYFSEMFSYREYFYYGSYQSIFEVEMPEDVLTIKQAHITSSVDCLIDNTLFNTI